MPGSGDESDSGSTYDAFKRPPDLKVSKIHQQANRFALPLYSKNEFCPCCGLPVYTEELELCCKKSAMAFNGQGVPLFFDFLCFVTILLVILGVVSGGYNVYMNSQGSLCHKQTKCTPNIYNLFSFTNRVNEEDTIQYIVDLISTFLIMIATVVYRLHLNSTINEIDNEVITVSDFSIQVSNLPKDATESEIKTFFSRLYSNRNNQQKLEIITVNLGYNLREFYNLQEKKLERELQLTELMNASSSDQAIIENFEEEITTIKDQISKIEADFPKYCLFTGVAFITYNRTLHARRVRQYFNTRKFELMLVGIASIFITLPNRQFRGRTPHVMRATEPGDILWQNLGVDFWVQFKYTLFSNFTTLVILGVCFASILGISTGQDQINQSYERQGIFTHPVITILGVASSLVITALNALLTNVIKKLVQAEENATQTEFQISCAQKLGISQFINTAIIPLLVNLLMLDDTYLNRMVDRGGLNSDVLLIIISSATLPWLLSFFSPAMMLKTYKRNQLLGSTNSNYTQMEANLIFEDPVGDLAERYTIIAKTLLLTMFYAQLLPLGIFINIGFVIIYYWVEKRNFLHRYSRGPAIGAQMAENMFEFFIELSLVVFAVIYTLNQIGNCVWQYVLIERIHQITQLQLFISVGWFIIPIDYLVSQMCPFIGTSTEKTFSELKSTIWDDYAKRNPVTMQKAIDEWMDDNESHANHLFKAQALRNMKMQNQQKMLKTQHGVMNKIATNIQKKRMSSKQVVPFEFLENQGLRTTANRQQNKLMVNSNAGFSNVDTNSNTGGLGLMKFRVQGNSNAGYNSIPQKLVVNDILNSNAGQNKMPKIVSIDNSNAGQSKFSQKVVQNDNANSNAGFNKMPKVQQNEFSNGNYTPSRQGMHDLHYQNERNREAKHVLNLDAGKNAQFSNRRNNGFSDNENENSNTGIGNKNAKSNVGKKRKVNYLNAMYDFDD